MPVKVAVVGAGSWGTAVACIAAAKSDTVLWARRPELAERLRATGENGQYLPGLSLAPGLRCTSDLGDAVADADVVVMAVPSHGFREVLSDASTHVRRDVPVLSLSKGLEPSTGKRMTQVVADVLPGHPVGVLTGPTLANEVARGFPAASVVAIDDDDAGAELQALFSTGSFRVYRNRDVTGCEIAGALKNVMAIAAGMADGMGFGDNTRAALITRGLAELTRLGVALGGQPLTFSGLAGMGDLVATCSSRQSRNRHVGEELGRGRGIGDIVAEMSMVAEGVKTAGVVTELAAVHGIEMPIAEQVAAVLAGVRTAREALPALMERQAKPELYGL